MKGGEKEGRKVAKESLALVILQCILLIFLSPRVNVHSLLLPMVVTSYLSTARHTKQKEENERTVQSRSLGGKAFPSSSLHPVLFTIAKSSLQVFFAIAPTVIFQKRK